MRKSFALLLVFGLILALSQGLYAQKKQATVTGELIDFRCYAGMGEHGEKHEMCAVTCAKGGSPIAVLDEKTGTAYTILAASPGWAGYMAKKVRISGKLFQDTNIVPMKLEVMENGKWKEKKLPKNMM